MTAYLITWKEEGWPHVELRALVDQFIASGSADELWRFKSFRRAQVNDRIYALKQGPGPKAIFATGFITGQPHRGSVGGKIQGVAPIRFDALVDPRVSCLVSERVVRKSLGNFINTRSSGMELPESARRTFEACIEKVITTNRLPQVNGVTNQSDAITEIARTILQRVGQNRFRETLLKRLSGCVATGVENPDFLRAAHIKPWSKSSAIERLDPNNGLLLSPNFDIAFELGYITIENDGKIIICSGLDSTTAESLGLRDGIKINGLTSKQREYLRWHREHKFKDR